jgi:hypothetical protein
MNVRSMQEHHKLVAKIAGEFGVDLIWVGIDAVGDLKIGMDASGNVDTRIERFSDGLWGVFRHGELKYVTEHFETALRWALEPLAEEGLYKTGPGGQKEISA